MLGFMIFLDTAHINQVEYSSNNVDVSVLVLRLGLNRLYA